MKIQKGIPIPPSTRVKYPFAEMKVGDSFLIEGEGYPKLVYAAAYSFGNYHNKSFIVRRAPDCYRCWRTK